MPQNVADKHALDACLTPVQWEAVLTVVDDQKRAAHPIDAHALTSLRMRLEKLMLLAARGLVT